MTDTPPDTSDTPDMVGHDGPVSDTQAAKAIANVAGQTGSRAGSQVIARFASQITALEDGLLYRDNDVQLLIDGPATYTSMLTAIATAQRYIHLETYILADDEIGKRFAAALTERRQNGVAVRVIYDSVGSISSKEAFFEGMRKAGIEIIEFKTANPLEGGNPIGLNNRTHRKLLIIDDAIAFTGGINYSGTYSSGSSHSRKSDPLTQGWRDTHIAVTGPAVTGFSKLFLEQWNAESDSPVIPAPPMPNEEHAGDDIVAVLDAIGGDGIESTIYRAYLETMRAAEERVWITQAYFAPDKLFTDVIRAAATRGVDVRIIAPGFSDSEMILHASRSRYGDLLEAGVRIFELTGSLLHAKTAVIDGVWSTVGSSNLDYRSFLHNDEVNAVILGKSFGSQMEAQFSKDMENCKEVTLSDWNNRSLLDRMKEKASWMFEYWL